MRPKLETYTASRLWGRGRLRQLLHKLWCGVVGHEWTEWHYDWPWDVPEYWAEIGEDYRDPFDYEPLLWGRICNRSCGVGQMVRFASILDRDEGRLPKR